MLPMIIEYSDGVFLDNDLRTNGIVLRPDSGLWSLDPEKIVDIIREAKNQFPLFLEYSRAAYLLNDRGHRERFQKDSLELLSRIDQNPFASEKEVEDAKHILEKHYQKLHKKKTYRQPRNNLRSLVIKRDQSKCRYCGVKLSKREIHIDHIIPYSLGGLTDIDNLVVACESCNLRKGGRILEETGMILLDS